MGYVWGKYQQDVLDFEKEWHMMSFAYKWYGTTKIHARSLPDFKLYKKDPDNDRELVKELWKLLDEADVVVAHNGDAFDVKKANARFLAHGLKPPAPYTTVDTVKIARRMFLLNSNKLDDIGKYLNVGRKMETGGFGLWRRCMAGDMSAWRAMVRYNKQDVQLLEDIYNVLRTWAPSHPNLNVIDETRGACPRCGSAKLQARGYIVSKRNKKQRYQCRSCGGWCSGGTVYKTNIS